MLNNFELGLNSGNSGSEIIKVDGLPTLSINAFIPKSNDLLIIFPMMKSLKIKKFLCANFYSFNKLIFLSIKYFFQLYLILVY